MSNKAPNNLPLESIINKVKKVVPNQLLQKAKPAYHWLWSFGSALYYRFPARRLNVIMITGTKGKTTTAELVNHILKSAGHRTALASTLQFKIFDYEKRNPYKMSVPGRGVLQKFLRQAVYEGCDVAIMEMTSQAVLDSRHRFLFPNALVFTNLEPEHIEAHGSYENYVEAKLQIADELKSSLKNKKAIIANLDDKEGRKFISRSFKTGVKDYSFSMENEVSRVYQKGELRFTYKKVRFTSPLQGLHNLQNILAGIKVAEFYQVPLELIAEKLESFKQVRGRLEQIEGANQKGFEVYVDYAHTPESLRAVYETFPNRKIIGVLGNTGGGRDTWKRPEMAKIAEQYCDQIILTDEDPYDESPKKIINEMYQAIENKEKVTIELDRRKAIRQALKSAKKNSVVLITGKGTDPYIMRANGEREDWDDASVVREELEKF